MSHDLQPAGPHDFRVSGMDCGDCANRIERTVARLPGVTAVSVSLIGGRMSVDLDGNGSDAVAVRERVTQLGFGVTEDRADDPAERSGSTEGAVPPSAVRRGLRAWTHGSDGITTIASLLLVIAVVADLLLGASSALTVALYVAPVVVGGVTIARTGVVGSWASRSPDMNLLMTIAVLGAAAIGAWAEAALVVVLFSIGEALERRAVSRARRELESLVSLTPDTARVLDPDGEERVRDVRQVQIGDRVVVRPGDRVPTDGVIAEGRSSLDQAAITGESVPVDREPGDAVFAGTINGEGRLVVDVTVAPGDTTLDRIGRLVAEAQAQRSPAERWVTRFAQVYTPIVIGLAVAVAVLPTLAGLLTFDDAFYAALALLILACPCALVLSTPVSIVSALGRASAAGVLVKGGAQLERAAAIRTVAFDKTGTLTNGTPAVTRVVPFDLEPGELLRLAAAVEQGSAHPLAAAIVAAAREADERPLPAMTDGRALTGLGAVATVDGHVVRVGSPRLLAATDDRAVAAVDELRQAGATVVLVERDGNVVGAVGLADRPRASARDAIDQLARLGIHQTVMLTGDHPVTARAVAAELGVRDVRADLLPEDKADAVARLGSGVAMVGDGVNDAPALARADIGLAMGSAGSDTAIEVADVALLGDDPRKVAGLIGLARWTRVVVRQNIAFSLGTKLVAAVFLLFGALPLWAAVGVDVGASLIVVANGLRLVGRRPLGAARRLPLLSAQ
ncbi:MAG: cadmium-translocating P-type ATPase [Patulibacter sp.]|nr:cadmium-translocating P-type ATPase [Patulibacter sp.]